MKPLPPVPLPEFDLQFLSRLVVATGILAVGAFDLLAFLWLAGWYSAPVEEVLPTAGRFAALAGAGYAVLACAVRAVRRHRHRHQRGPPGA